jgi:hypothetical protein
VLLTVGVLMIAAVVADRPSSPYSAPVWFAADGTLYHALFAHHTTAVT